MPKFRFVNTTTITDTRWYIETKNLIGAVLKAGNKVLDKYTHDRYKNLNPRDFYIRSAAQFSERWLAKRCFAELCSEIEQDNDTFGT